MLPTTAQRSHAGAQALLEALLEAPLAGRGCVQGQRYKYSYVVEVTSLGKLNNWRAPSMGVNFSNVIKYNMETGAVADAWEPADGYVFGEVEFVPRAGSDHSPAAADRSPEDDGCDLPW